MMADTIRERRSIFLILLGGIEEPQSMTLDYRYLLMK